ncbi:Maf-like protein [Sinorhizobium sp. BG8]|uniref:Maf-like protein n=1 Tax=Sinorhizobium sp. BG8 TaxID=2613773 RepID=UPI00193D7E9C|nr:Maf-like protein [Sinorhizobium sp. BG8]QRM53637.1 Maf-like protein [Sinorhizobium sp. BG8]
MSGLLILASQSPFRRMLMQNAGLAFETAPAEIDEREIEVRMAASDPSPKEVALALAEAKAQNVSERFPGAVIIGSDQTLSLGRSVFHKPADMDEARSHLLALSGRTHELNSAVVFCRSGEVEWRHVSTARLKMRELSAEFIARYLSRVGEKALSSVGAYQLEGEGIQLFDTVEGDYFTIVGLPMLPVLQQLREMAVIDG